MEKNKIKGMFVNLLMKHGKKSRALYLLEASVYLFIRSLLKIKIKTFKQSLSIKQNPNTLQSSSHVKKDREAYIQRIFFGRSLCILSNKGHCLVHEKINEQTGYSIFPDYSLPVFLEKYTSDISKKKRDDICTAQRQVTKVEKISNTAHLRDIFPFLLKFSSVYLDFYGYQRVYGKKGYRTIHSATVKKFLLHFHIVKDPASCLKSSETHLAHLLYNVFAQPLEKKTYFSLKKPIPKFDVDNAVPKKWYSFNTFRWQHYTEAQKNTHLHYLYTAISNVKPPLECKSKRFGGSNRQIPATVSENRQWGIAITWIIEAALHQKKKKKAVAEHVLSMFSKARNASTLARGSEQPGFVQDHTFYRGQVANTLYTLSAFRQQARIRKPREYSEKYALLAKDDALAKQGFTFFKEKNIYKKNKIFDEKDFAYPKCSGLACTEKVHVDTKNSAKINFLEKYTHLQLRTQLQNEKNMSKKDETVNITPYNSINGSEKGKGFAVSTPKEQQSAMLAGPSVLSLQNVQSKNLPVFCHFLAEALQNAYYKRGSAVEKRDLWVDTAVTNRAYLRDRWW